MNFYGFSFIPGFLVFGCKKYFLIPLCVWLVLFVNILEFSCECQATQVFDEIFVRNLLPLERALFYFFSLVLMFMHSICLMKFS
jgi:hypothetical protein